MPSSRRIRAGRSVTHFETVRQRKDGSLIDISLTVSPIYDDAGVVIGASKIARDISAQKRDAFDMRRLAAAVESSDDAIVTKTLDGIITSWNRAAERMFGYTEAEAVGQIDSDADPRRAAVARKTRCWPGIRAGLSIDHYETIRQRKDGTRSVHLADGLADPRRCGRDRRRLEDRPRHHRAGAPAAAGARARRRSPRSCPRSARSSPRRSTATPSSRRSPTRRGELTTAEFGAFFYNVRDARLRRRLHALHAVGRAEGGLREFPPSARHRGLRADVPRRGDRSGSTTSPSIRASARTRRSAACRRGTCRCAAIWPCRCRGMRGDVLGGLFFGQLPRRGVHRPARAARRSASRRGPRSPGERAAARRGPRGQPHEGRVPGGAVARAADAAERHRRLLAPAARRAADGRQAERAPSRRSSATPTG